MEKQDICYEQFTQDREVRITDLIEEILRHIWLVILLAVVCGAALTGYKYWKDSKEISAASQTQTAAEYTFTAEEQAAVDNDAALRIRMAAQTEYMENSVKMQIDPYAENRTTTQFLLSGENAVIDAVYDSISYYISSGAMAENLTDEWPDLAANYLAELISAEYNADGVDYIENTETNLTFCIAAVHADEESSALLMESVLDETETYLAGLQQSIGDFSYTVLGSTSSVVTDTTLLAFQESRTSALTTLLSNIESLEEDMSEDQLSAVALALSEEAEEEADEETEEETVDETASASISIKYLLVGVILGIAAAVILIILGVLLRGTLENAEEFRNIFHISLFGQIDLYEKNGVLVSLWRRLIRKRRTLTPDEEKQMVLANLTLFCRQNGITHLLLTGSLTDERENAWIRELTDGLAQKGISVRCAVGTLFTPDGVDALADCEYVVLVERLRASAYEDVCDSVKTCLEYDRKIIGAVALN